MQNIPVVTFNVKKMRTLDVLLHLHFAFVFN